MRGFEDVTLAWEGAEYTVPANEQLMLICEIEDALQGGGGVPAVVLLTRPGGPSHARLCRAFGAALRYAGAEVSDDEVYLKLQGDMADGRGEVAQELTGVTLALLAIVSPPTWSRITALGQDKEPGKPKASG